MILLGKIHKYLWRFWANVKLLYLNLKYKKDLVLLSKYKDKYKGKRCFVIGTGPSLTVEDLEKLNEEYTFASNSIFRYLEKTDWRPNFYSVCDTSYFKSNHDKVEAVEVKTQKFFPLDFAVKFGSINNSLYYLRTPYSIERPKFKVNPLKALQEDSTVTYFLLQLAVMMGFKEIYLLGIDFNYSLSVDNKGVIIRNDSVKDLDDDSFEYWSFDTWLPSYAVQDNTVLDYLLEELTLDVDVLDPENVDLVVLLNGTMSFHRSRRIENNNDQPLIEFV